MLLLEDILIKIKNCIDVPYNLGYNLDEDDTYSAIVKAGEKFDLSSFKKEEQ